MVELYKQFFMKTIFQFLIRIYQKTISPDHSWVSYKFPGGYCPFRPTCSQYAHDAIGKYGVIKGCVKAAWRIIRCHPWTKGGLDLP